MLSYNGRRHMQVVKVKNVNQALPLGMTLLYEDGVLRQSRAGDVIEYPEAVATIYEKPRERVLFSPERDANPFFHLATTTPHCTERMDIDGGLGSVETNYLRL